MATYTYYPDAGSGSTTVDSNVGAKDQDLTWANIRALTPGDMAQKTDTDVFFTYVQASTTTDQFSHLYRGIATFDVSGFSGDVDAITGIKFGFYLIGNNDTFGSQQVTLTDSSPAANNNVVVADFQNVGTTAYSAATNLADLTTSAVNTISLNAAGIAAVKAAIAGAGIFKLGARMECDRANSAPTWGSGKAARFYIYMADNGTNKPYLEITAGNDYVLTITAGSYALTGIDAIFTKALNMVITAGSYVLTGVNVTLSKFYNMVASVGSYTLTGIDIVLKKSGWNNIAKHNSSPTNISKHNSTPTNQSKS